MVNRTVFFDISGHGLGHLSISAPVISEFINVFPSVDVIVRSQLPQEKIRSFVDGDIKYLNRVGEVTLVAPSALEVDADRSVSAYEALYERWGDELHFQSSVLRDIEPDLIVSNIDYLSLAAAQVAGIPAVALCCMNWADMFRSFCAKAPHFHEIERLLLQAYSGSSLFLQPQPHMSMADIDVRRSIGPIARVGCNRADALRALVGCARGDAMVLHSLGGWPGQSYADLPRMNGVKWLVSGDDSGGRSDISSCRDLDWPFADIVASVDAVVGKDSYGTVVEAACAGVPLVISPRGNWPEEKCLLDWGRANCNLVVTDRSRGGEAGLQLAIERALSLGRMPAVAATGIREAIDAIATVGRL